MIKHLAMAAVLSLAVAGPVAAAPTVISFTGGSSSTDGTDGNVRTGYGNAGIQVQASAFSYDGTILEKAYLGAYSSGLGVTNNNEGSGSNNTHVIDNIGQHDFVLLIFNQPVNIVSAVLTPFDVSTDPNDNDAWVSYATLAGLYTSPATPVPLDSSLWSLINAHDFNVNSNGSNPVSFGTGAYGNAWVIGAANPNPDRNDDGFKLTSITVNAAVPEPATWAMMILGFGAIGMVMRRRMPSRIPQVA